MLKINSWLGQEKGDDWRDTDQATVRAGDVEREIADDPTTLTLIRAGVEQSAQTVRLLRSGMKPADPSSIGGEAATDLVTILGDAYLDVQYGDRFVVSGFFYEVIYVIPGLPGRVEAKARQVQ